MKTLRNLLGYEKVCHHQEILGLTKKEYICVCVFLSGFNSFE